MDKKNLTDSLFMWDELTVKDFEYTRKAVKKMNSVIYSAFFEDMDSAAIFDYLLKEMELVSFKDYLKRYIYTRTGIEEPFSNLTDNDYKEIICESFKENGAPFAFEHTTKKTGAIIKGWLTQDSVKRSTVFVLGFGLRMTKEDVSEFLLKVLKEEDFNSSDPEEVIYSYCYEKHLPYAVAHNLIRKYVNLETDINVDDAGGESGEQIEEQVCSLLEESKKKNDYDKLRESNYKEFLNLYDHVRSIIAEIYSRDEDPENRKTKIWTPDEITPGDLEKVICNGIPMEKNGNLRKMNSSVLSKHFHQKRMSRQRLESLFKKTIKLDRFDLITLQFFIYSQEQEDLEPEVRCRNYIDDTNQLLERCGMMKLYPVNAYEAFVLMCLSTDSPLPTYSEIWEMSYNTEE